MPLTWLPPSALLAANYYAALFRSDKLFLRNPASDGTTVLILRPEIVFSEITWRVHKYEYSKSSPGLSVPVYLFESARRPEASAYLKKKAMHLTEEGFCLEDGVGAATAYRLSQWKLLEQGHESFMKELGACPSFGRFYSQAYHLLLSQSRIERIPLPHEVGYLLTVTGISLSAPDGCLDGMRLRERLSKEVALTQCCCDVRSLVHALGGLCALRPPLQAT